MELAFGVLHLTPDTFWNMSMMEFSASVKGYRKSNGLVGTSQDPALSDKFKHFFQTYEANKEA